METQAEAVIGYFHKAGTPRFPEQRTGEQPIFYEGKQIGTMEFQSDGQGRIKMIMRNFEGGEAQLVGSEPDPAGDEEQG